MNGFDKADIEGAIFGPIDEKINWQQRMKI